MQTDATFLANNSCHCWMLHVTFVCTSCCILLEDVAHLILNRSNVWSHERNNSQHCWPNNDGSYSVCLHFRPGFFFASCERGWGGVGGGGDSRGSPPKAFLVWIGLTCTSNLQPAPATFNLRSLESTQEARVASYASNNATLKADLDGRRFLLTTFVSD